ncbi:polysaccharide biosynthesis tyrosine autokinase [Nesterenkonia sp. LB17]|uniref:polysaccharide biosynthesis tyrosine autokinase n=1 Tax=Nesterenkonia sp. LB17 TaxID=2901230 RepID=UPI001F4C69E3|nr:polysaccharide biosynthesis tyrosine autokinase [Nesterenkonia sp. LB17]MCH8564164.1 polysaccharide biosynthesis tyrosine autokinase [Nesterenkonia sp. LB17]
MELQQYVRVLKRGWLTLVLAVVVTVGAAAALVALLPATYEAETRIYVAVEDAEAYDLSQRSIYSQELVRSFVELARSSAVLGPVVEDLELEDTPRELAEQITVAAQTGTVILEVTVADEDPQRAAAIATSMTAALDDVVQGLTTSTEGDGNVTLTAVEEPFVPDAPSFPQPISILGLGLLAGLAIGIVILALREVLDTKVRSEQDITEVTDQAVLGGVQFDRELQKGRLIAQADVGSPLTESFSTLGTNLQFLAVGQSARSFVVTSSIEAEGKSSVAVNLAISLRAAGHRVLLVDADLRRPMAAQMLGLEGAVGLTDVLSGRVELPDVIQFWGPDNLEMLPAGTVPPNPIELLGSEAMEELVAALQREYEIIIFDAPPLLPVSDARVLGALCSGVLLVVAVGRVHKPQLQKAIEAMRIVDVTLFGVVPTMLPPKAVDGYSTPYRQQVGVVPR